MIRNQKGNGWHGRSRAAALERQTRAIELFDTGYSYDKIAEQLGYANRSSAWRAVDRGLRSQRDILAGEHLQLHLDRLEAVLCAHWAAATEGQDASAAQVVLNVLAQLDRLLGLSDPGKRAKREAGARPTSMVLAPDPATYQALFGPHTQHMEAGRRSATASSC